MGVLHVNVTHHTQCSDRAALMMCVTQEIILLLSVSLGVVGTLTDCLWGMLKTQNRGCTVNVTHIHSAVALMMCETR